MRIDKTVLIDGTEISFGDFNVFIGGNGVGKTTFIVELFYRVTELVRNKYFWINEATCSSADVAKDVRLLKGSFARQWEGASLFYLSNATKDVHGNVDLSNDLRFAPQEMES